MNSTADTMGSCNSNNHVFKTAGLIAAWYSTSKAIVTGGSIAWDVPIAAPAMFVTYLGSRSVLGGTGLW